MRGFGMSDPIDQEDVQVHSLLSRVIRLLAERKDNVVIMTTTNGSATTFTVSAHSDDLKWIIGRQGVMVWSLRTILHAIGMTTKRQYTLFVDDETIGPHEK